MTYPTKKIFECIDKVSKPGSVLTSQYLENGDFPIVDQGKKFIAGYTNNKSLVYSDILPVVVFGDHTRAVKFIDFSFAVGADGTKVLKPIDDFEPKFFYYMLLGLDLGGRGYARHFKLLKELEIPLPPLETQKKIVAKLDVLLGKIKEAKKLRTEAQESTNNLLSAELNKIFAEGKAKGWEKIKIVDVCEKVKSINPKEEYEKEFLYIDISSVHKGKGVVPYTMYTIGKIPSRARRPIKKDDVLFALTRPYLKNIAFVDKEYTNPVASTGFAILRSNKKVLFPKYLYYIVTSDWFMEKIIPLQTGATYPAVSESKIFLQTIPIPPLSEQKKIVAHLDSLSENIKEIQQAQTQTADDLTSLEQSILHKAFNGELV